MYERGVALFRYPHVKDIWAAYLSHFVARYKGTKLERARDLFRQALDQVPPAATSGLHWRWVWLWPRPPTVYGC